jgi:hypothetical protein
MHRPTIGLIAVVLLVAGFATRGATDDALSAALLRVGLVMAILWFAHPQIKNLPKWWVAGGAATLFLVTRFPKLLVVIIPIAAILWFLGPRTRRGAAFRRAGPP